jgi:hypothetical protein
MMIGDVRFGTRNPAMSIMSAWALGEAIPRREFIVDRRDGGLGNFLFFILT